MPASCASLPAPMKRSVCSPNLSILKDEIEEGFAEKDKKRRGSGMDSKPKPAKKIVGQPTVIQNKAKDSAEQALKVDERLRLARERREQQQKELASREQGWLAREERAKRHYEKHLEERRRKLEDQRMREERRRKAVEEKRRQRLNEERERYEQVVKKTMERSQKAKQKLNQLARQRAKLNANKAPRCRPLTEWEKDLVRRLQTPTIAQLARSRSVGASESDAASCHQVRSSSTHKVESPDAKNHHKTPAVKPHAHPKTTKPEQCKQKSVSPAEKRVTKKNQRTKIQAVPVVRPSPPPDPPPDRPAIRAVTRRSAPQLEGLLPPLLEEEPDQGSSCDTPPQDGVPAGGLTGDQQHHVVKMIVDGGPHQEQMEEGNLDTPPPSSNLCPAPTAQNVQPPPAASSSCSKPSVGTTDPEEASRLLAEKRRQARLQREEKRREEFERQAREELARRQAEENARQQAEAHQRLEEERKREEEEQKQMEEKKKREEEQQRQIEEENTRRLQRQREEEEAHQREMELKRQRDQHFQKEEEARQERKKRLEEIMKRTRKADSAERKPAPASTAVTEPQPKENTEPVGNHREDVILLSGPSQPNKLDLDPREDVPSVTFKERRSLRTLTGLDHIQSQQRAAEVI